MKFGKRPSAPAQAPKIPSGRRRPTVPAGANADRPQAFSYYSQRSSSPAHERQAVMQPVRPKRRLADGFGGLGLPASRNGIVYGLCGLVLLAGLVSLLALSTSPQIVADTPSGSATFMQQTTVYQQAAANSLDKSLFNRSKLTVDAAAVARDLTEQYPELRAATVSLPLFGMTPVVHIEPYPPAFIVTTTSNGAFLIDTNGRALVSASQITDAGELSVPRLEDNSGIEVRLGAQVLSSGTVTFVQEVVSVLDAARAGYTNLVLPAGTSELDVSIKGKPYMVKFNLQGDARTQAGAFLATKQRLEGDKITPNQYIDVRVPDRAYYR